MEDRTPQERTSPETAARIRESCGRQGLMGHLGARLTHIAPGRVHLVLREQPRWGTVTAAAPGPVTG